jgi:hypothetical protein
MQFPDKIDLIFGNLHDADSKDKGGMGIFLF